MIPEKKYKGQVGVSQENKTTGKRDSEVGCEYCKKKEHILCPRGQRKYGMNGG
jgi:hypothetical protein